MEEFNLTPEEYEKICEKQINEFLNNGGKKILKADFNNSLIYNTSHSVSLSEIIERYKHLLAEEEYKKLKEYENRKPN